MAKLDLYECLDEIISRNDFNAGVDAIFRLREIVSVRHPNWDTEKVIKGTDLLIEAYNRTIYGLKA